MTRYGRRPMTLRTPPSAFFLGILKSLFPTLLLVGTAQVRAEIDQLPVVEHRLQNGLTVLLLERHHSPTVACQIAFRVGSNNERPGVTGSAHMLEHMMFKGTKTIGTRDFQSEVPIMAEIDRIANALLDEKLKGEQADSKKIEEWSAELKQLQDKQREFIVSEELTSLYNREGASGLNAYTSSDYTNYIVKLPANKLELWCWLESDRIANPVFREFYAEKEVVHEERRMRVDTDPSGALWELFNSTLYHAHPYNWMTIGWPSDIENYRRETMQEFFTRYYAPNNAVVVWVGSFDTAKAIEMIEKYFGNIPAQPEPPAVVTREPEQKGERRVQLEFDANPSLMMGWPTVSVSHPDQPALEVLQGILSDGRTSRLYKKMREGKPIVSDVGSYAMTSEYPGCFILYAEPLQTSTLEETETTIRQEVENLHANPVDEWELQRVKNQLQAEYVQKLESNYVLARDLAEYECKSDWTQLTLNDRLRQEVTPEDLMRVASTYLKPSRLTVAELVPTASTKTE